MLRSLLLIALSLILFLPLQLQGQKNDRLIQFSGVVVTGDSLEPIPYANIIIKDTYRGTTSDYYGYFSFVAQEADTIVFSAVGFKKSVFVIPDSLANNKYSLIQVIHADTFLLRETFIYPWPSKEQFREAFMNLVVPDDDIIRGQRNLAREQMYETMLSMPMDGSENYKLLMQNNQSKLYYAGQAPPLNLLNPLAWAQFVKAWQRGDFKAKDK